jgi:hypothetical protein
MESEYAILVGGIPTPLKNMKVSWDEEIPNRRKHKFHVPKHQPDVIFLCQPFIIIQFIYHPLSSISHDQPDF